MRFPHDIISWEIQDLENYFGYGDVWFLYGGKQEYESSSIFGYFKVMTMKIDNAAPSKELVNSDCYSILVRADMHGFCVVEFASVLHEKFRLYQSMDQMLSDMLKDEDFLKSLKHDKTGLDKIVYKDMIYALDSL